MRIVLIFPRPRTYIHNETFEPLGLLYLGAGLPKYHDVKLIDCFNNKLEMPDVIKEIINFNPDLLGVSLTMSPTVPFGLDILKEVKNIFPAITTVVGGVHATFDYQSLIRESSIDYLVLNEGEIAFSRLVEHIEVKRPVNNEIPGVVYQKDGKIIRTTGINIIEDLDSLNFPARELLADQNVYKRRQVLSSRGCVYRCIYCAATAMNNYSWRKRSPANVIEEINIISNKFGGDFYFADDNFTVDNRRVLELCGLITENELDVSWSCLSRVENIKSMELLWAMREAGCYEIFFGIESGSEPVLRQLGRHYSPQKVIELIKMCNEAEINTTLSFIIGFPFEKKEDIKATLDLAEKVATYNVAFHLFTPYPGTEAYINPSKFQIEILAGDYNDFDKNSYPIINTRYLTAEEIFNYYCEGFGVSFQKARRKSFQAESS